MIVRDEKGAGAMAIYTDEDAQRTHTETPRHADNVTTLAVYDSSWRPSRDSTLGRLLLFGLFG
jgi:hypothetical protein